MSSGDTPPMPGRDERITAFLDGVMTDAEQAAFEAELAADPALAAEVERMAGNDASLRQGFAAALDQPMDADWLARIGLSDAARPADDGGAADNVVSLTEARERRAAAAKEGANDKGLPGRWPRPVYAAMAASLLLAIVVAGTWTRGGPGSAGERGLAQGGLDSAAQIALNDVASGSERRIGPERSLAPQLSFQDGSGRYCREYVLTEGTRQQSGIACRGGDGWVVEARAEAGGGAADGGAADGGYRTASGRDGGSLDDAYDRLQAGDPLPRDAEQAAMARGWTK